jgi:DNA-directed RNA polymerase beta' subunit
LMGKRRDQSGRSPISADPTVSTDELVVPRKMAQNLTIPERVASYNIESLQKLINRGCANYVLRGDSRFNLKTATLRKGTTICWGDVIVRDGVHKEICIGQDTDGSSKGAHSSYRSFDLQKGDQILRKGELIKTVASVHKAFTLQLGDVVERWLQDGDYVLFNRQPTLHKGSLMAKRIIIKDGKTLRFNLASTKSFNADFDGDEMNVFLAQELDARAELAELCTTKHNIMSCQSTKNIICITQDSLLGAYLLTKTDHSLGRDKFFDICMHGEHYLQRVQDYKNCSWSPKFILDGLEHINKVRRGEGYAEGTEGHLDLYCGKSLFSLMLPRDLNYTKKNDTRKDQPSIIIRKGVMLEGAMSKAILGSAHNSLIHILYKEYGMDITMDFINNCQFISNQYMLHHSFSIGIGDCVSPVSLETEKIAYKCFLEAKEIERTISHPAVRELMVCSALDKSREMAQVVAKNLLHPSNSFLATVTSGSRGEMFNLSQIFSMLGQQIHMTKRIAKTLNRGQRTLPCYPLDPTKLTLEQEFESRGFVSHSFGNGLTPQEFVWHSMAGREGLTNTALNTASSGYVMRKLVKCFEDIQVQYGGIVTDTVGSIFSFAYGGDGFDRTNMSFKSGKTYFCDVERIASQLNNSYEERTNL